MLKIEIKPHIGVKPISKTRIEFDQSFVYVNGKHLAILPDNPEIDIMFLQRDMPKSDRAEIIKFCGQERKRAVKYSALPEIQYVPEATEKKVKSDVDRK